MPFTATRVKKAAREVWVEMRLYCSSSIIRRRVRAACRFSAASIFFRKGRIFTL